MKNVFLDAVQKDQQVERSIGNVVISRALLGMTDIVLTLDPTSNIGGSWPPVPRLCNKQ